MNRLLLDECVDWRLKRYFSPEYEVRAVHEMGWQGVRNSELLQLASQAFDVLITVDKRLPQQQDLAQYPLSVVVIRAPTIAWQLWLKPFLLSRRNLMRYKRERPLS